MAPCTCDASGPDCTLSPDDAPPTLLRNRRFVLLLSGHFLSALAPMTQRALVLIWVFSLTGSGTDVGYVGLAEAFALLAAAPLAGVFADRWSRSGTMAGVVLVQAALLLPLLVVQDRAGVPLVFVVTLAINAAAQFYGPAAAAALPGVVGPALVGQANGMLQTAFSLVLLVAPGLAAAGFAAVGPHAMVAVLIAVYLGSAPLLFLVRAPAPTACGTTRSVSVIAEFLGGARYVLRSRLLLGLLAVNCVAALGSSALGVLDVVFATRALHRGPEAAGVLLTASGAGQLAGGALLWLLSQRWSLAGRYPRVLRGGVLAWGLFVLAYAAAPTLALAATTLFAAGVIGLVVAVTYVTLVQLASSDAYRGRVMSLLNAGASATAVLSTSAGGALSDVLGIRSVLAGAATILVVAGLIALVLVRETPGGIVAPINPSSNRRARQRA